MKSLLKIEGRYMLNLSKPMVAILVICLWGPNSISSTKGMKCQKVRSETRADFSASVYYYPFSLEPDTAMTPQMIKAKVYLVPKIKTSSVKQIIQLASKTVLPGRFNPSITRIRVDYNEGKSVLLIDRNGIVHHNGKEYRIKNRDLSEIRHIVSREALPL